MELIHTPVESFVVRGREVLVKREDLCCALPGPPFSKMRGVWAHLSARPEALIGVLDTSHSKAGWAVAHAGRALGKRVVNYFPVYAKRPGEVRQPQRAAADLGAELVGLPAGRSAILFHQAKRLTVERGGYMMPNALKLDESVEENARELAATLPLLPTRGTIVVSISSGTIAAGLLRGLDRASAPHRLVLHLGYSRTGSACLKYLAAMSGVQLDRFDIRLVDEGYAYADAVDDRVPFPSSPYYDAKAWRWLARGGIDGLADPVIFWNIGA